MSGLFGILDGATRSIFLTQSGLRTTSHNISNVNTPGYSRQRVVIETADPLLRGNGHLGTGAEQTTIQRITDDFVHRQLILERGAFGSAQSQTNALMQVEEILNEQGSAGILSRLADLYAGFGDLASATSPGAPAERSNLRAVAESLIDTFQRADAQLRAVLAGLDGDIVSAVARINDISQRIAELNVDIVSQETMAPANDLRDRRDELVRELSGLAEVTSFEQTDGSVVVLLSGGLPLAEGAQAHSLQTAQDTTNPFNPAFSRVVYDLNGLAIDTTGTIGSGELGGLLRARDTILPAAIRSLDTVAYNLIGQVNAVHSAGIGLDGSVGNFFTAVANVEDAARDLALDPSILANPDSIAAGLTTDPGDNRNALALADLRDTAVPLFLPGDPPGPAGGPTRTLLNQMAGITGDIGEQSRSLQAGLADREHSLELLENRREQISGVSLDEEMTNLIRLQAVFQANARVVATVQQLIDDVLRLL